MTAPASRAEAQLSEASLMMTALALRADAVEPTGSEVAVAAAVAQAAAAIAGWQKEVDPELEGLLQARALEAKSPLPGDQSAGA